VDVAYPENGICPVPEPTPLGTRDKLNDSGVHPAATLSQNAAVMTETRGVTFKVAPVTQAGLSLPPTGGHSSDRRMCVGHQK
jgi:hypothetical protein